MKLVVVALMLAGTVFASREPVREFGEPTSFGVDSGESAAEQEQRRLANLEEQRQRILNQQPKSILKKGPTGKPKKSINFTLPDKNTDQASSVDTVAGQDGLEDLSPEQKEDLVNAERQSFFHVPEGQQHPLSTLETVETQLSRNESAQEKIKELESKSLNPQSQQAFKEDLSRLEAQQDLLVNSQEFLTFCKDKETTVVFSGSELQKIFTVLNLPSLSEKNIQMMSLDELANLDGTLSAENRFVSSVQEDGSAKRGVGSVMTDEVSKPKKGYSIDEKGNKSILKQYFDAPFTKEKKNLLVEYLRGIREEISKQEEIKKADLIAVDNSPAEDAAAKQELIATRLAETKNRISDIKSVLEQSPVDWDDYNQQLKDLSDIIQDGNQRLNVNGLAGEGRGLFEELEQESSSAITSLEGLATIRLRDSFTKGTLQPGDFNQYIRTIVMKDSNLPDLVELKKFEITKQNDLKPEQQKFIKKIVEQTETFANLKAQAQEALKNNNVIRMQELQDELRDIYEDVYRNNWKDEGLTKLDLNFLKNMRNSINNLLQQFSEKSQSFTGVVKNKKSFTDRVKYQFKRLFVRATIDPRKMRYRSEVAENTGLRLNVVDFKKAATDGYVKTVTSVIEVSKKTLTSAFDLEREVSSFTQSDAKLREQALLKIPDVTKKLETQINSAEVIQQQRLVLQGVADCNGTLTCESVRQSVTAVIEKGAVKKLQLIEGGAKVEPSLAALIESPATAGYALDAYINKKDVTVPSAQAKTILKQLTGKFKEEKEVTTVPLDGDARAKAQVKNIFRPKDLKDLIAQSKNVLKRLQQSLKAAAPVAPALPMVTLAPAA